MKKSPNKYLITMTISPAKTLRLKLTCAVLFLAGLFMPLWSSWWFALFMGASSAIFVYLMIETQPYAVYTFVFIVGYFKQVLLRRVKSAFSWFKKSKTPALKVDRLTNHASLTYYDPDNGYAEHIFLFRKGCVSNDLIVFTDGDTGKDVTDSIAPYLGPMQNFHGSALSPDDFGFDKIKVFRDGDINLIKTFSRNEPITFEKTRV